MAEILTVADLERAKQDDTFHAEVITGKLGGNGADIDFATHARTGQIQMTLPAMIRNYGFGNSGLEFGGGGTLNSSSLLVKYNVDNLLYRYTGTNTFPIAIPSAPDSNWQAFAATVHAALGDRNHVGAHDAIYTRGYQTVAAMIAEAPQLADGVKVEWRGYYTESDGGSNWGIVRKGDTTGMVSDGGSLLVVDSNTYVVPNLKGKKISVKKFGAKGDGVNDTLPIQAALNYSETIGGCTVYFPNGSYMVSINTSSHPYACVLIPKNTILKGETTEGVLISRPSAERDQNGVLLVNKNYDALTDYQADGNIVIDGITISDGAVAPNRAAGDLIGFGNGSGLLVQNCKFLNHDQHAVDICRSKNVIIRNNKSDNDVNLPATATYQIDAGLILGIAGAANIGSSNIFIYENEITGSFADNIIHFHTEAFAENVYVFRNLINATQLVANQNAIGGDTDISYKNTHIFQNDIKLNHAQARGINLPSDDTVALVENLRIYNNKISGKFRVGISAGDEVRTTTDFSGGLVSAYVYDNQLNCDCTENTGNTYKLINLAGFKKAHYDKNSVRLSCNGQASEISCIGDIGNRYARIHKNSVERIDSGTNPTNARGIKQDIEFNVANGQRKIFDTKNNTIDFNGCTVHIAVNNPTSGIDTYTTFNGVLSENTLIGTPTFVHLYESLPVSDGTNNLQYVDFSAHGGEATNKQVRAVAAGQYIQNIPLTGKKAGGTSNQRNGIISLKIFYAPSLAGLSNDSEAPVVAYLSATTCAGIIYKDVDVQAGIFDLVTGSDGVSMTINDTTFQPVVRTAGYIKVLCGI